MNTLRRFVLSCALLSPALLGSAVLGSVMFAEQALAQITYVDFDPDIRFEEWEAYQLDLKQDQSTILYIWKHPNEVVINTHAAGVQVLFNGDYPVSLEAGATISSTGTWKKPAYSVLNNEGTRGNWINVTDRYLPIRFQEDGSWHYAWARLDIDQAPTHFTLKDYAFETAASIPIAAGASSSASVNSVEEAGFYSLNGQELITHEQCSIELFSLLGVKVLSAEAYANEVIDLKQAGKGMFVLVINGQRGREIQKIVIQ